MKIWGFVVTASAVIIAVLAVTAGASANINQDTSLKEQGSPIYNADSLTMFEEGDDFNDWNLNAERAKKKDCYEEGGSCILKKTAKNDCSGKLFKKYKCRAFKRICCIPDTTTNATIITPGGTIEGGCPDGWEPNAGNCFWFSSDRGDRGSWKQSWTRCQDLGHSMNKTAGLAELGDPQHCGSNEWLMETITSKGKKVWLGARNWYTKNWIWWNSGRSLSLENPFWGPNQPDNKGGNEWCVNTWPVGNYNRQYLNDMNCSWEGFYVCQLFN